MAPPVRLVETRRAAYQQCIEDVRNLAQVRGALLAPDRSDEYAERGRALNDAALAWESKVRLLTNNQRTVSACHDFVFSARDYRTARRDFLRDRADPDTAENFDLVKAAKVEYWAKRDAFVEAVWEELQPVPEPGPTV